MQVDITNIEHQGRFDYFCQLVVVAKTLNYNDDNKDNIIVDFIIYYTIII